MGKSERSWKCQCMEVLTKKHRWPWFAILVWLQSWTCKVLAVEKYRCPLLCTYLTHESVRIPEDSLQTILKKYLECNKNLICRRWQRSTILVWLQLWMCDVLAVEECRCHLPRTYLTHVYQLILNSSLGKVDMLIIYWVPLDSGSRRDKAYLLCKWFAANS